MQSLYDFVLLDWTNCYTSSQIAYDMWRIDAHVASLEWMTNLNPKLKLRVPPVYYLIVIFHS